MSGGGDSGGVAGSRAELARIASAIADPSRALASLIGETGQLRLLAERHSRLSMQGAEHMTDGESTLPGGWAISPVQAALCAREPLRSAAFIQGLAAAIRAASTPHKPVAVLYAGCGPFALLALPLMALFTPQQVQFTLLEVHRQTLDYARQLIEELGYGAHVAAFICTDAASYHIARDATPDVIVSETMNTALGKEPQVAIMRNLYPQAPGAALVPAAITVHLGEPGRASGEPCADWGNIFTLDGAAILEWQEHDKAWLPAASIRLPAVLGRGPKLLTRIRVHGDIVLHDYDCSLNLPLHIPGKPLLAGSETLDFSYRLGSAPGLVCAVRGRN